MSAKIRIEDFAREWMHEDALGQHGSSLAEYSDAQVSDDGEAEEAAVEDYHTINFFDECFDFDVGCGD